MRLRDLLEADKEKIRQWRNLPQVAKYMYTDHHISVEEHEHWFQKIVDNPRYKYWIIEHEGLDVGLVNLYDIDEKNKRCYWAFYIAEESARGKGIGSFVEYSVLNYVFENLEFHKLCCEVLGFNEPVVRMHERFGFKQEGLFREHIIKGDTIFDVVALGILADEWRLKKTEVRESLLAKGIL